MGLLAITGWANMWSIGFRLEDFANSRGVIVVAKLILLALIVSAKRGARLSFGSET